MTTSKAASSSGSGNEPPRFVGMLFGCCNVYARLYLRADGRAYAGRCPKCGKGLAIDVRQGAKGGFFEYR